MERDPEGTWGEIRKDHGTKKYTYVEMGYLDQERNMELVKEPYVELGSYCVFPETG